MKQLLSRVAGFGAATTLSVQSAFAMLNEPNNISGLNTSTDIKGVIILFIERVLDFVILIAVVYIIVAGIGLIISNGEEAGDKKNFIVYVIVGLIVVLFARVIVTYVNTLLG